MVKLNLVLFLLLAVHLIEAKSKLRRNLQRGGNGGGGGGGGDGGGGRGDGGGGGGGRGDGGRGRGDGGGGGGNGGNGGGGGGNGDGGGGGGGGGGNNVVTFPPPPENMNCGTNVANIPSNDLGVRFNKVIFQTTPPAEANGILPLGPEDFPICPDTVNVLRQSTCWSVIMESDCEECDIPFSELINAIGGLPTHPVRNDPTNAYWDELWEVIVARQARLAGNIDPQTLLGRVPAVWSEYSLEDMADAVHNEYPGKNQAELIEQFIGLGIPVDRSIVPSNNEIDFLRYQVMLAEINTWAIATVGPSNFGLKFSGGRARPEEIVWFLHNQSDQQLAAWQIPQNIVTAIRAMNLQHQYDFTAYDEGSPTHPSWPAMHSAGSVASFWLPIVLNLSQDQMCEAMALDFGVSYGRTIAGVHFPADNTSGLNLGQEIIARKLPQFLNEKYGANIQVVTNKINRLRFNWEGYFEGPCFN